MLCLSRNAEGYRRMDGTNGTNGNVQLQGDKLHGEGLVCLSTQLQTQSSFELPKTLVFNPSTQPYFNGSPTCTTATATAATRIAGSNNSNHRSIQSRLGQFLQDHQQKQTDGMKKRQQQQNVTQRQSQSQPQSQSQRQSHQHNILVRHRLGQFATEWSSGGTNNKDDETSDKKNGDHQFKGHTHMDHHHHRHHQRQHHHQQQHQQQQISPERRISEGDVLALNIGIVPTTNSTTTNTTNSTNNNWRMSERSNKPRRVSLQDLSSNSSHSNITAVSADDSSSVLEEESGGGGNGSSSSSMMEDAALTDDSDYSSCWMIPALPFDLAPPPPPPQPGTTTNANTTIERVSKEEESKDIDMLYPFGNLFPIEDLQQDLFACDYNDDDDDDDYGDDYGDDDYDAPSYKRSLEEDTYDLSLPPPPLKRCKSSDLQEMVDILALEQNGLLENTPTPTTTTNNNKSNNGNKSKKPDSTVTSFKKIAFCKWYIQCQLFRTTHGHCAIPLSFPENPDLAYWARSTRMAYSRMARNVSSSSVVLSQDQIHQLNQIGFCWNLKEHNWNVTFESLKDQVRKHGVAGDCHHTRWLKAQRKRLDKNRLTSDQAQKLLSLQSSSDSSLFMNFSSSKNANTTTTTTNNNNNNTTILDTITPVEL